MNKVRLLKLAKVGDRILAGELLFDLDHCECGAYACWFGWYRRIELTATDPVTFGSSYEHFGITREQERELFTPIAEDGRSEAALNALRRRVKKLRQMIGSKHAGIPSKIRAIFSRRSKRTCSVSALPWD